MGYANIQEEAFGMEREAWICRIRGGRDLEKPLRNVGLSKWSAFSLVIAKKSQSENSECAAERLVCQPYLPKDEDPESSSGFLAQTCMYNCSVMAPSR